AEDLGVSPPQTMHRDLHGVFRHPDGLADLAIRRVGLFTGEVGAQGLETARPLPPAPLLRQAPERPFENRRRPLLLEQRLRSQRVRGLDLVAVLRRLRVERHERFLRSALARLASVELVGEEVPARRHEKRPEPAELGPDRFQIPAFDEPREVALCQVARLVRAVALAPDERVERIPVPLAEFFEGGSGFVALAAPRGENDVPASGSKAWTHEDLERTDSTWFQSGRDASVATTRGPQLGTIQSKRERSTTRTGSRAARPGRFRHGREKRCRTLESQQATAANVFLTAT